ncbi:TcaA NTF2-like domain-containing protein [Oceanobacillus manasiensis]|uniref:TcaA NTF2-like domain-containing protein n=1 Tax=Oceanobacillus manasiensis TaxID=586413 RepID=UPI0005AA7AE3|nr:zinc ribbon domain-containing protein [Oceanobacillus manasiensis]
MNKFCKECGSPITTSLNFCQHCGHQLEKKNETRRSQTKSSIKKRQHTNYTKKQKVIISIVAVILIMFAGFYMWGKSYVSAEKTVERFVQALKDEDEKMIQNTAVLSYDSELSDTEARALAALAKADNEPIDLAVSQPDEFLRKNELFTLVQNGKWLGIFDRFSIAVKPQYIEVYNPFKDVTNTFDGVEFSIHKNDDNRIVYGPMSPGIYNLNSNFTGEYTEVEANDKVTLADADSDSIMHEVHLDADYVTLDLYNENGIPIEKAYLEMNDQKVNFGDSLIIDELGPLNLDGSVTVTPVIETKWGNVKLDKLKLEKTYYELTVDKVSGDLTDMISAEILTYGEGYVKAHAGYDAKVFTNITGNMKESFVSNFEYYSNDNSYFTGQLDKIEVDFNNLSFYEEDSHMSIPTAFYFTSAFHSNGEEAELDERIDYCNLELVYQEGKEHWLIDNCQTNSWYSGWDDGNDLEVLEGSKQLQKANVSKSVSADEKTSDDYIEEVTLNYIYKLVEAINTNNYEQVRPFIKDGSDLDAMQSDLVDRLNENGIEQEVISATVSNINEQDGKWVVSTNEKIKIIYESGEEETNDYVWKYTVEADGDNILLVNIEE